MADLKRHIDKDLFLAELLKGKSMKQTLREFGRRNTALVYKWKKADPVFAEAYDRIMDARRRPEETKDGGKAEGNWADWKEKFLFYFNKTDDRINAADRAGIKLSQVFETMDKEAPQYDENFTLRFREVELKQAVRIEDDMRRKALVESKDDAQKFLLPTLPIIGDKYKKGSFKEAPQQNFLAITFTHAGIERAERSLLKVLNPRDSITAEDAVRQIERT